MNIQDISDVLKSNIVKRHELLANLEAPVRAALNVLKDAGLMATAAPISEILFQIDVLDDEIRSFCRQADQRSLAEAMVNLIAQKR